jgi:ferredoxin
MSFFINQDCISCSACLAVCPNQATGEGSPIYVIYPDKCTECIGSFESPQCAAVCPVDACHPDPNKQETKAQLLDKWKKLHPGEEPKPNTY